MICDMLLLLSSTSRWHGYLFAIRLSLHLPILPYVCPQYTGGTLWAVATLDSFKEECRSQLYRNTSLWVQQGPATHPAPPSSLAALLCLNDCSGRGACHEGEARRRHADLGHG